mgnify:FL=1
MSERLLPCMVVAALAVSLPSAAQAGRVHETGKIGVGIGGGPVGGGITGKWFMNEHNALQGLVGIRDEGRALLLSPDYLYTFDPIFQDEDVTFGWYGGFGGALSLGSTDFTLGASAILGVDFCIDVVPLDIYAELRPMLILAPLPEMEFMSFAGGVRYYF